MIRCPKTAPTAKLEASHMISKGSSQLGEQIIGAEMSSFFRRSKEVTHSALKSNGMSFPKRVVKQSVGKSQHALEMNECP